MTRDDGRFGGVARWALTVTAIGFATLVVYGATATTLGRGQGALGAGLLGLASVAVGAILGFLFAVPVSLPATARSSGEGEDPDGDGEGEGDSASGARSRGADQLVQVADWVTRIFIGATVTQLGEVRDQIQGLGELASAQILGGGRGEIVFTAAVVYGAVFGFFVGHLSTRLILNLLFAHADRDVGVAADVRAVFLERGKTWSLGQVPPSVAAAVAAVDAAQLETAEDLQVWGLARIAVDHERGTAASTDRAFDALARAVARDPSDRTAVESQVLGALYAWPPEGFQRAIAVATDFLGRRPNADRWDATLYAYLAAAHGQGYTWAKNHGEPEAQARHRQGAVDAVRAAIARDSEWLTPIQLLATSVDRTENDLADLAVDDAELRAILRIR